MFISKLKLVAAGLLAATGITLASTNWSVAAAPAVPLASLLQGANTTGSSTRQDADQEKLQGTWYCIAIIGGGSKQPPADVMEAMKQVQLIFKGDQVTLKNAPNGDKGNTYRLDPSTTPKRLTMVNDGRTVMNAVYALEGDVLILTFREGSSEFPSSLAVTRDLQGGMMVLQKTPLFPPNPEAVKNMKAMSNKVLAQNSMRQIGLAAHIYADKFNKLPRNITDKNGKPLLSWRVALLPYLEAENLYRQFKLDEAWDSEHNRKLIPLMPKYFSISDADMKSHTTPFRSFIGNGAVMEHEKDLRFADIKDGTSNTILFVEAREAVIWTKPDDLDFIPNKPLPKLGGRFGNQFLIVMCDGSSHSLLNTIGDDNLKALITRAGNEEINLQTLQGEAKPPVKP